ncbi:uncharacterized protein HMPREF1541_06101 [Cyphellophora europaea CBS 101466]|uniref:Heterokaryon incompatibility domain-containing protein n=1 Tax=Cyphellophora europaea (strain CBS 101466) TaxID=1220924 RepID=W2RUB3_CYPE1|nr:uncharacterized protein HMPREF1541_06101 [Cyphellophora europaea CBS 101466]ETN39875.1 hypothetical protein HMPREF1541_06101 [Cyphellophora europaea CBS 101466]
MSSLDMRAYQYQTISSGPDLEITRIFHLAPGAPADPVVGKLLEMNIADPRPFEALSYVWGPDKTTEDIYCDDAALPIRANVAQILRKIRHPTEPRPIWVDQVCINQVNLYERSKQVRHMNTIYRKALRVLVCLGDDDGDGHAEPAFALIRELAGASRDMGLSEEFQTKQRKLQTANPPPDAQWESLTILFQQPWFDRKWILQEIGTDAPASLLWADARIDWSEVAAAANFLKDDGFGFRRAYGVLVWKPYYMDKLFSPASYADKKGLVFAYELHRARWQKCGDPRDHIFALLGHPAAVDPVTGKRWVEADYTKRVEEVYHETAMQLLANGNGLMVLNVVQHESLDKALQRDVPSWVPQWDDQASLHNLLGDDVCVYNPSRDIRPAIQFTESSRVLISPGLVLDTISAVSWVFGSHDFSDRSTTVGTIWAGQPECERQGQEELPSFTTTNKYRNQQGENAEPALLALLETLSAVKKRRMDAFIPLRQRQADAAAFVNRVHGNATATGVVGDDIRALGHEGDEQRWLERASGGAQGRCFARGWAGFYALCPPAAQVGDKLCLLFGGKTLYCLRPTGDAEGSYRFVGECYVHGVMDGEALNMMEAGDLTQQTLRIR